MVGIIAKQCCQRIAECSAPAPEHLLEQIADRLSAYRMDGTQAAAVFKAGGANAAALVEAGHKVFFGIILFLLVLAVVAVFVDCIFCSRNSSLYKHSHMGAGKSAHSRKAVK